MKKIIFLAIFFIFLSTSFAFAQTSLKAEVDKKKVASDELVTYRLIVGSTERKIPQPQIPKFEGFDVISRTQSSSFSFGKGSIKTIFVYAFTLAPKDKGKFNIEPSTIKIGTSIISSEAFEIEVTQGKSKPRPKSEPKPGQKPSLPNKPQSESKEPQLTI